MMNLFKNIELTDEEEELLDRIHEQTPLDPEPKAEEESPEQPVEPAESDEHADEQ